MIEIRDCAGGVSFLVRVQPRASDNEVEGEWQGALRVRLNAPPVEGRANEALLRFLAEYLKVPVGAVRLVAGERSRTKRVEVRSGNSAAIRKILNGNNSSEPGATRRANGK